MKKIIFLLTGILVVITISCNKTDETATLYSIIGKVQKGPFIIGTNITLNELNNNLVQSGRSFSTTIVSNDGSFGLKNIELESDLVLLTANGFYFSEIYGELSVATLSLQAISDLTNKEAVNINVLTHIIKGRIENLVSGGMDYRSANKKAKAEMLLFLGISDSIDNEFESLDISNSSEANGILLAFSVMLQRHTMVFNERMLLTSELTQLISSLSADFATDGEITDNKLIDRLLFNISQLNLTEIRNNVEKLYSDLGQNVTIPNFEKYIAKFQEKHSSVLYTSFLYPTNASPAPVNWPNSELPNILVPDSVSFVANMPYTIAAIAPLNTKLTIKFTGNNSGFSYGLGGVCNGWEIINDYPNGFTLVSQRSNELMTMLFQLGDPNIALIEYFEGDTGNPTRQKRIEWK